MSVSQTAEMLNGSGDSTPGVTIDMMDYGFIEKCTNVKQLEKVLRDLRSGKHGYYPHLIEHCEKKIILLNPKSKALRKENPIKKTRDLPENDRKDLANGLEDWMSKMKEVEKDFVPNAKGTEKNIPPVRTSKLLKGGTAKPVEVNGISKSSKDSRIKSWDYKAWDKFDADEECGKVEEKAEKTPVPSNKKVNIPHKIDSSEMSKEEKCLRSAQEKEKGNEAFKSGDFEEAIAYYSRSINLVPVAASINNRALAYLRVEDWKNAEKDCNQVLDMEPDNLKAKLRRATALKQLNQLEEAKSDLNYVLSKESNNARAKKLLEEVETKLSDIAKMKPGRKMMIDEVESSDSEDSTPPTDPTQQTPDNNDVGSPSGEEKKTEKNHEPTDDISSEIPECNVVNNDVRSKTSVAAESGEAPKHVNGVNGGEVPGDKAESKDEPTVTRDQKSAPKTIEKSESPPASEKATKEVETVQKTEPEQKSLPSPAEKIKHGANRLFRNGQYGTAADKYTQAIEKVPNTPDFSHARALLYSNRAACKLKIGEDRACIEDCTKVLELKPFDVKALIRRASAYEHKERYTHAYVDFKTAQMVDYNANQAQDGANRTAKHLRDIHGPKWIEKLPEIPKVPGNFMSASQPVARQNFTSPPAPKAEVKPEADVKSTAPEAKKPPPADKPKKPEHKKGGKRESQHGKPSKANRGKSAQGKKNSGATKSASQKADEDAKKKKIRQELFEKLKEEGNSLVRKGNFSAAIESYTKCIQIAPDQVASFTNRALCFLKLNKHISADHDCTAALKLDPKNVKALFRRAQSRRSLKLYKEAEADLKHLLVVDPGNKSAQGEMKLLQKELKDLEDPDEFLKKVEEVKIDEAPKRKMVIEELSDDDEEDEEKVAEDDKNEKPLSKAPEEDREERKYSKDEDVEKQVTEEGNLNKKSEQVAVEDAEPRKANVEDEEKIESSTVPAAKSSTDEEKEVSQHTDGPQVTTPVTTPYEFGHLWNAIQPKTNIRAYKNLIDRVDLKLLPTLVSNKTDAHMITTLTRISRDHMSAKSADGIARSFEIMKQMTKARRFNMAVMFLNADEKKDLLELFAQFASHVGENTVGYSKRDVEMLRKGYMV